MTSRAEKLGTALAQAVKGTAAAMKEREKAPVIYRTNLHKAPTVQDFRRDDGWVDAQVQFLIDKKTVDADHTIGRTVLKPGARHENHRLRNCDSFFIVLQGHGMIYTEHGDIPSAEGDVVYAPRGSWHGFSNTSDEDVVLVWGWMGVGSIEDSGYETHPENRKSFDQNNRGD
jgi:quercetin dioxygenase-like cupin family protein